MKLNPINPLVKLLLGFLAFALAGVLTISTFTVRRTDRYLIQEAANNHYREAKMISTEYALSMNQNIQLLEELQDRLSYLGLYLDASIQIVNTQGRILMDSRRSFDPISSATLEGFDISTFGDRYYQTGNFSGHFNQENLSVFSPITVGYQVRGYVLIHKPVDLVLEPSGLFLGLSYQTLGILSIFFVLILAAFAWTVQLPVRKITKELDDDQRQFLANVSHDFRSPLTSIKGYIEAILDGTIPMEGQEKYLKIILSETERLTKLTRSILELNKYSSNRAMLDMERFDINNVIKMILQVFEGICIRRKISFDLILSGQSLFVFADVSKIQQVVYNLIDNAIKFSPDRAVITVETTEAHGKALVSIKDQGPGIPKSSLKKIWKRFYKIDASRGMDKKGTGLGLAIAHEIMQAHHENISVNSTEGTGSEFIFTLSLAK